MCGGKINVGIDNLTCVLEKDDAGLTACLAAQVSEVAHTHTHAGKVTRCTLMMIIFALMKSSIVLPSGINSVS